MQSSNAQNTQSDINPVVAQVLDLLGMDKTGFEETKSSIEYLLKQAKRPENIVNKKIALLLVEMGENPLLDSQAWKNDKQISLAMIKKDPANFAYVTPQFKNLEFGKATLESMVKQRSGFISLQKFITDNFAETKIQKKLGVYMQSLEGLLLSDIDKSLIHIKQDTPKIYTSIFAKRFLDQRKKQLVLHSEFVSFFRKQAQDHANYLSLEPMDRMTFDLSIFQGYLGLSDNEMTEEVSALCIHLRSLISLKKVSVDADDIDDDMLDIDDEDLDDEVIHSSTYSYVLSGELCNIDIGSGENLKISQSELDIMTDVALGNYIAAVKMFTDLGLGFILNHKRQFFGGICGFDYLSGDGLDESKCLRVLNKIGKKVGLPTEESVEGEESKKCFKTLGEAKYQFRDMASTGNVGDIHYNPMESEKSIVRRALEDRGFFDREGRGFLNLKKW